MKEKDPHMATSVDEIDLLELLAKAVWTIRNNLVIITIAFLLGSLLGLTYFQISPNVYQSKMFISSDILTESYAKSIIDNLVKLIREENTNSLSKKLNLALDQSSKIADIKILSAVEKPEGAETGRTYFHIEVKTIDNSIWPQLQEALIAHLQNNEFVKIRVEQKKSYSKQVIEKINLELQDLEKLKTKIAEGGMTQSSKESLFLFDPTTVNSKILELNKERINLQNSLETVNSVQLIEGFTVFNKPTSPKLSLSIAAGSMFGLFCVGLFISFKAIRSLIKFSEERVRSDS